MNVVVEERVRVIFKTKKIDVIPTSENFGVPYSSSRTSTFIKKDILNCRPLLIFMSFQISSRS
jgi:hypothetical protein